MYAIRRFSAAIRSPWAWANPSSLRVERRFDGRTNQPHAFVFAENGEVVPTVFFLRNPHPNVAPCKEHAFKTMIYRDIDELVAAGWRPYSEDELDIGLAI